MTEPMVWPAWPYFPDVHDVWPMVTPHWTRFVMNLEVKGRE